MTDRHNDSVWQAQEREHRTDALEKQQRRFEINRYRLTGLIDMETKWQIVRSDMGVDRHNRKRGAILAYRVGLMPSVALATATLKADAWVRKTMLRQILCAPVFNPINRQVFRLHAHLLDRILSKPISPRRQYRPIAEFITHDRK